MPAVLFAAGLNAAVAQMAQGFEWVNQFGTSGTDVVQTVAVDVTGVYVAGWTDGILPGETGAGGEDAFLQKYDLGGHGLWTRQFGSSQSGDRATDVAVDGTGAYVAGWAGAALPGETYSGGIDTYLRKYDGDGSLLWTRQFGTPESDATYDTVGADGIGVYVAGVTYGTFPGEANAGSFDVFLRKYDGDGNVLWTREFGTPESETAWSLAVDATGVYVAGYSTGTFPGETYAGGDADAFLRKYDGDGNVLWTREFGTLKFDQAKAIAVDATGAYVAGQTPGAFPGETNAGGEDVFLRKYDGGGNVLWTRQFGTPEFEGTSAVAVDGTGVYVSGSTYGTLSGESKAGGSDAFLRKYDGDGNVLWTREFGTPGLDTETSLALDATGAYIAGFTDGTFPGETSAGGYDGFLAKLSLAPTGVVRFDLHPNTLNLMSRGRWVTARVDVNGAAVRDLDPKSLALNGVPVAWTRVLDNQTLLAKFDRAAFAATVHPGDAVVVTLTGEWRNGSSFTATDTIRIIRAGR